MKVRRLIGNAAYGPDFLKVLFDAFDEAWDRIVPTCGTDPQVIEAARTKLASIILSLAGDDPQPDVTDLKERALRIFGHLGGN